MAGEIFTSLKQYLGNDKDVVAELQQQQQQSVIIEKYRQYKKAENDLKLLIEQIEELRKRKRKENDPEKPESSTINIKELQEIRDSLLQESETQATHLTNLLEQTYKFQFQIQTLLSSNILDINIHCTEPPQG
ncbi:6146_t:CDS:2 [Entrophospora sp. SA101]|nr:6146_t:CDS:2 [Entrophospora sp. SA101]